MIFSAKSRHVMDVPRPQLQEQLQRRLEESEDTSQSERRGNESSLGPPDAKRSRSDCVSTAAVASGVFPPCSSVTSTPSLMPGATSVSVTHRIAVNQPGQTIHTTVTVQREGGGPSNQRDGGMAAAAAVAMGDATTCPVFPLKSEYQTEGENSNGDRGQVTSSELDPDLEAILDQLANELAGYDGKAYGKMVNGDRKPLAGLEDTVFGPEASSTLTGSPQALSVSPAHPIKQEFSPSLCQASVGSPQAQVRPGSSGRPTTVPSPVVASPPSQQQPTQAAGFSRQPLCSASVSASAIATVASPGYTRNIQAHGFAGYSPGFQQPSGPSCSPFGLNQQQQQQVQQRHQQQQQQLQQQQQQLQQQHGFPPLPMPHQSHISQTWSPTLSHPSSNSPFDSKKLVCCGSAGQRPMGSNPNMLQGPRPANGHLLSSRPSPMGQTPVVGSTVHGGRLKCPPSSLGHVSPLNNLASPPGLTSPIMPSHPQTPALTTRLPPTGPSSASTSSPSPGRLAHCGSPAHLTHLTPDTCPNVTCGPHASDGLSYGDTKPLSHFDPANEVTSAPLGQQPTRASHGGLPSHPSHHPATLPPHAISSAIAGNGGNAALATLFCGPGRPGARVRGTPEFKRMLLRRMLEQGGLHRNAVGQRGLSTQEQVAGLGPQALPAGYPGNRLPATLPGPAPMDRKLGMQRQLSENQLSRQQLQPMQQHYKDQALTASMVASQPPCPYTAMSSRPTQPVMPMPNGQPSLHCDPVSVGSAQALPLYGHPQNQTSIPGLRPGSTAQGTNMSGHGAHLIAGTAAAKASISIRPQVAATHLNRPAMTSSWPQQQQQQQLTQGPGNNMPAAFSGLQMLQSKSGMHNSSILSFSSTVAQPGQFASRAQAVMPIPSTPSHQVVPGRPGPPMGSVGHGVYPSLQLRPQGPGSYYQANPSLNGLGLPGPTPGTDFMESFLKGSSNEDWQDLEEILGQN
uniref:mastermind-like protein 3 isoform X2 n=1 Tax=Myxine glutinosa TaxID=7769 RepID=UPI0035901FF5